MTKYKNLSFAFRYITIFTIAPFIIGLIEASVVGASKIFSACFYSLPFLIIGLIFVGLAFKYLTRESAQKWKRNSLIILLFTWCPAALIISRFLVYRNLFHEHSEKMLLAWLIAFFITLITSGLMWGGLRLYQKFATKYEITKVLYFFPLFIIGGFCFSLEPTDNLVTNDEKQVYEGHPGGTILIVVDTLRADVLNAYAPNNPLGGNLRKTPNIDALIAKGLLFKNLYAQASWTRPAVASIMTGKLSSQHGVMSKTSILGPNHQTMAELFHEKGYKTLGIGNNANLTASFGFSQGFDNYHYLSVNRYFWAPRGSENLSGYNMMRLVIERYSPLKRKITHFYQPAEVVSKEALALLDKENEGKSFFLYLHYMDTHDPYFGKNGQSFARVALPFPKKELAAPMLEAYLDEVERFDKGLGILIDGLIARGLQEKVRIILTADHGEEFGDHGGFYHGTTLYQEQLHVPLIMSGPGLESGINQQMARQYDILPTVAAWHNFPHNQEWAGQNLLLEKSPEVHFAEEDHQGNQLKAVIKNGYSLIVANKNNPRGLAEIELFDLATDPRQRLNLAETNLTLLTELKSLLESYNIEKPTGKIEEKAISPEVEAQLRALGYTN